MAGKPFTMVAINGNDELEKVQKAVREHKLKWKSIDNVRDGGAQSDISEEWNVQRWPTAYVLDHKGTIRFKWVGETPTHALEKQISTLLGAAEATVPPIAREKSKERA